MKSENLKSNEGPAFIPTGTLRQPSEDRLLLRTCCHQHSTYTDIWFPLCPLRSFTRCGCSSIICRDREGFSQSKKPLQTPLSYLSWTGPSGFYKEQSATHIFLLLYCTRLNSYTPSSKYQTFRVKKNVYIMPQSTIKSNFSWLVM